MSGEGKGLSGLRVLLAEDEFLVAMDIETMLVRCGCTVIGPASRLDAALRLAGSEAVDAAVLDVNLNGELVYPVAAVLAGRGIPFVLTTGYGEGSIPEDYAAAPRLAKPFGEKHLIECMERICGG